MYRIKDIKEYKMTRSVILENLNTGTVDECFDDSALVSKKCFDFIKIGKSYNCKMKLFGEVVNSNINAAVLCKIISRDIMIGSWKMLKVLIGQDEYYIPQNKLKNLDINSFYFKYSRKDLIQVDNVIHADLL